jgi:hypothetical protein
VMAVAKITKEVQFRDTPLSWTGQMGEQEDWLGSQTAGIHSLGKRKGLQSLRRKGK